QVFISRYRRRCCSEPFASFTSTLAFQAFMLISNCLLLFVGDTAMGFTRLKVFVGNPVEFDRGREIEFLVDSGAYYTMVPRAILEEFGIVPIKEQTFTLANGEKIRRQVGLVNLTYKDRPGASLVIFGEEGDQTLMGVLGLESMGYKLDPVKMEL